MIRLAAPIDAAWQRAIARANEQAEAGRRPVYAGLRGGRHTYRCASSKGDGKTYTQTVVSVGHLHATCDCEHSQSGRAGHCWHQAAVLYSETVRLSNVWRWQELYAERPAPKPARDKFAWMKRS